LTYTNLLTLNPTPKYVQEVLNYNYDLEVNNSIRFAAYENPYVKYTFKTGAYVEK
jgi:hypothetical protein